MDVFGSVSGAVADELSELTLAAVYWYYGSEWGQKFTPCCLKKHQALVRVCRGHQPTYL